MSDHQELIDAIEVMRDRADRAWATLIDHNTKAESSLAEALAQVAELEGELRRVTDTAEMLAQEVSDPGTEALAAIHCARAVLHREPGDAKPVSATDMRERAAKLAETAYENNPPHAGWEICGRYLGKAIRALPLTALQDADDAGPGIGPQPGEMGTGPEPGELADD